MKIESTEHLESILTYIRNELERAKANACDIEVRAHKTLKEQDLGLGEAIRSFAVGDQVHLNILIWKAA